MNITVNGKSRALEAALTVEQLLESLGLETERVAVELNRDILTRSRFAETSLSDGDVLEVIQFVGGG
ncbi:thiamine biosynthesis protein ThiS [Desulfuromonas versatilis]|uniref:Thiamine biosynthesis protein ThiS n=1 Tax=Desulfuromonas versatilis TaxID=2802975 RepID=A0ABM8HVC9_9BACT|nr:sulfur carrier protein ThiS [Desulfuromonas versatilis]BCR05949.1 thiamine biosynthesis protein ThiS [Desulfuromonas versatilis]